MFKLSTESFGTAHHCSVIFSRRFLMSGPSPSKLAELRAKTDRDLVWLIGNALDVALLLTNTQVDSAALLYGQEEEIFANTLMLIPKVEDVSERRRLEKRVKQLGEMLEQRRAGWLVAAVENGVAVY
jgi:hypothetical protein